MTRPKDDDREGGHKDFFRSVLLEIHRVMTVRYGLRNITVRPLGSDGSRLSIPISIIGVDDQGQEIRYFGKILGSSDIMTERTIQFFKNIYLELNSRIPLFDFNRSAKDMAIHQFEMLGIMYDLGIPTSRPIGYHPLEGNLCLFLAEFLDVKSRNAKDVSSKRLDEAFGYLRKMHRNKVFHGDIKPENIIFGDKVYILDVGNFLDDAPEKEKRAYDLACQVASFLDYATPEEIVKLARKHYARRDLRRAASYMELVQMRPDIHFDDDTRDRLIELLRS